MKIMTFNVQNTYKKPSPEKISGIIQIISEEKPDIIGMQELTPYLKQQLQKELKEYTFYGRPRFGGFPLVDEYNALIVKKNIAVIETNTYSLGRRPDKVRSRNLLSVFPRICTMIVCVIDGQKVKVVNTHLDHVFTRTKSYQLAVLYELLKDNNYPLVIMGDFNMYPGNDNLKDFIKEMQLKDIGHDLGKTCILSQSDRPIDHILIDERLKHKNLTKKNIAISDHYPVVCDISLKKEKL